MSSAKYLKEINRIGKNQHETAVETLKRYENVDIILDALLEMELTQEETEKLQKISIEKVDELEN